VTVVVQPHAVGLRAYWSENAGRHSRRRFSHEVSAFHGSVFRISAWGCARSWGRTHSWGEALPTSARNGGPTAVVDRLVL
jgi:hypothetical protein